MNKAYKRINWENSPSTASPLNEVNLNRMDDALDKVDTRVVEIYNQKDAMASATTEANNAATNANTAAQRANTAVANANEAAQAVLDEKYILTATTEMVRSGIARPTAEGSALLEKLTGDSWQENVKVYWTYGNINATTAGLVLDKVAVDIPAGDYILKFDHEVAFSTARFDFFDADGNPYMGYEVDLSALSSEVNLLFMKDIGYMSVTIGTAITLSNIQILRDLGESTPDNPQTIHSTGDSGWFDGELEFGTLASADGTEQAYEELRVRTVNCIPCKAGDVIKVSCSNETLDWINVFFYSDDSYISYAPNGASFLAPEGATRFRVVLARNSGLNLDIASKVSITINGQYAVIVDEVGKNLFGGEKFADVISKTFGTTIDITNKMVSVVASSASGKVVMESEFKENTQYTIMLYGINSVSTSVYTNLFIKYTDGTTTPLRFSTAGVDSYCTAVSDANKTISYIQGNYNGGTSKFYYDKCGVFEGVLTLEDFEPYQHNRTYIPISEPLRSIPNSDVADELHIVDGEYKPFRRIKYYVFNGSEGWTDRTGDYTEATDGQRRFYLSTMDKYDSSTPTPAISDIGVHDGGNGSGVAKYSPAGLMLYYKQGTTTLSGSLYLTTESAEVTDKTSFVAWMSANPVELAYELAEPYYEEIADQSIFYNIPSYDEVTNVSIEGLHDGVNPTFTMRFPRNEDGALVTTAYCNGKKNEIKLAELTALMTANATE